MKPTRPEDIFRQEKERAVSARNSQHARLLAEAKAAFDKLMAEGQAARKSGRPRKHPLPPLKTSSSRTPPRPPAPLVAPPKAAPALKAPAPPPPAKAAATKPPARKAKASAASARKRPAAPRRRADAKRPAAKTKSKRSPRR